MQIASGEIRCLSSARQWTRHRRSLARVPAGGVRVITLYRIKPTQSLSRWSARFLPCFDLFFFHTVSSTGVVLLLRSSIEFRGVLLSSARPHASDHPCRTRQICVRSRLSGRTTGTQETKENIASEKDGEEIALPIARIPAQSTQKLACNLVRASLVA